MRSNAGSYAIQWTLSKKREDSAIPNCDPCVGHTGALTSREAASASRSAAGAERTYNGAAAGTGEEPD